LVSLAQLAQWLRGEDRSIGPSQGGETHPRPPSAPRSAVPASSPQAVKKNAVITPENCAAKIPLALTPDTLPLVWEELLNQVGPMFGSALRKAQLPAIFAPNTLVLRFSSG